MIIHYQVGVEKVAPYIGRDRFGFKGEVVSTNSSRLLVFKRDNFTCCQCKRVGTTFRAEKHHQSDRRFHLNLYAEERNKTFVLMTKDHIIPVSHGGRNYLYNLQTMCHICNELKGNKHTLPVLYKTPG